MKKLKLTCPFTGIEFTAHEMADGKLIVIHPLTGEQLTINWNCSIKKYNLPKEFFQHIKTVDREQAQRILEVTYQRVTQIIQNEIIPVHYINDKPVFVEDDVYEYRKNRKVGAPKKVKNWEK